MSREGRERSVGEDGGYLVATGGDDGSIALLSFDGLRGQAKTHRHSAGGKVRQLIGLRLPLLRWIDSISSLLF